MSIINHIVKGGFVFATSVAAFTHSVWVLGTLMSGKQPLPPNDLATTLGAVFLVKTIAWHFAPVLIATAIDIGFVQTSRRIESARGVGRKVSVTLYVTFGVLALTMYFLQFVYMAVHVPHIDLGAGVSEQLKLSLKGLFDASVFVIPALLPIAIALYTFASDGHDETPANAPILHDTTPQAPTIYASPETITVTPLEAAPALALDEPSEPLPDVFGLIAASLTLEDVGLLEAISDAAPIEPLPFEIVTIEPAPIAEAEQAAPLPDYTERAPLPFDDTKHAPPVKTTAKPRKPAASTQTQNTLL